MPDLTRVDVERKLTELATKATRSGRAHRDYDDWHYQMDQLLDYWRARWGDPAPVAPLIFSEEAQHDHATPTA